MESNDIDYDLDVDIEVAAPQKKRGKQPYKEATVRPQSKQEAYATEEADLFGDIVDIGKTPLGDLYTDVAGIHKVAGTNGLSCISTFTGCGGSSTGFSWAGWNELAAVEFVKAARDTLAANYPSRMIDPQDAVSFANTWMSTDDSGLVVEFHPSRKTKGTTIPGGINWEKTLEGAARSGDPEKMEAVERLRKETTEFVLANNDQTGMILWGDDIRGLDPQALLDALGLVKGELDCFEGSPPCKSFSTAGLREEGWGQVLHYSDERHQRTDDLFLEYVRILDTLRPRSFIAENVAGIGMGQAGIDVMQPLLDEFDAMGYVVEAKLLDTKNYGVPQSRPRMFFQGIRKGLMNERGDQVTPKWPDAFPYLYTCQEALDASAELSPNPPDQLKACSLVTYETGKIWHQLGLGAAPENKAFQLIRCHPDLPVPTITATSAGNQPAAGPTHPHECRKFTINEYRWLFSFPRDYTFTGNIDQQGERMGRSVPPHMMKMLAGALAEALGTVVEDISPETI